MNKTTKALTQNFDYIQTFKAGISLITLTKFNIFFLKLCSYHVKSCLLYKNISHDQLWYRLKNHASLMKFCCTFTVNTGSCYMHQELEVLITHWSHLIGCNKSWPTFLIFKYIKFYILHVDQMEIWEWLFLILTLLSFNVKCCSYLHCYLNSDCGIRVAQMFYCLTLYEFGL